MMKNRYLWLFLITAFCLNAYAQQKDISREEYAKAKNDAFRKQTEYKRRVTFKGESFSFATGRVEKSVTAVYEYLPPGKIRSLRIETTGGVTKKVEVIVIGKTEYRREDDGEWTKRELSGNGTGIADGGGARSITYKNTIADAVLNNLPVQIYEQYITIEDSKGTTFDHEKIWISKEGLMLKRENKSGYPNPEKITSQSVADYEYDPKDLKIEAPIK